MELTKSDKGAWRDFQKKCVDQHYLTNAGVVAMAAREHERAAAAAAAGSHAPNRDTKKSSPAMKLLGLVPFPMFHQQKHEHDKKNILHRALTADPTEEHNLAPRAREASDDNFVPPFLTRALSDPCLSQSNFHFDLENNSSDDPVSAGSHEEDAPAKFLARQRRSIHRDNKKSNRDPITRKYVVVPWDRFPRKKDPSSGSFEMSASTQQFYDGLSFMAPNRRSSIKRLIKEDKLDGNQPQAA